MRNLIIVFCIAFGVAVGARAEENKAVPRKPTAFVVPVFPQQPFSITDIQVARVVDPETIELQDGERIKLIGVKAPKAAPGGPFQYVQELQQLIEGKRVDIELDLQRTDSQGRTLAYVYLKDGTFVNAELLNQGYAEPETEPLNRRYKEYFDRLYDDAKRNNRGVWK
jgi:micrococcal nuclease